MPDTQIQSITIKTTTTIIELPPPPKIAFTIIFRIIPVSCTARFNPEALPHTDISSGLCNLTILEIIDADKHERDRTVIFL